MWIYLSVLLRNDDVLRPLATDMWRYETVRLKSARVASPLVVVVVVVV